MTPSSTLSIGTLRTTLVVSREQPDPEQLRAEVQSALNRRLGDSLARRLGASIDSDGAVWIIRSIHADAIVSATSDASDIAYAVAAGLARSLSREMVGSGDGLNAIRFDSRAAHLAHYLVDRLDHAADRWYYSRFKGLRALPTSAMLRTALTAAPALGLSAMQQLSPAARRRVAEAMTAVDCGRVLHDFSLLPDRGTLAAGLDAVERSWRDEHCPERDESAAVWLFATVFGNTLGGATLERAVNLFVQTAAARPDRHQPPAGSLSTDVLKALGGGRTTIESTRSWSSAGGVFLLLQHVDLEHLAQLSWRIVDDEEVNARCLALVTLGVALNGTWSPAFGGDLALLDLFRIPGHIDLSDRWSSATDPDRSAIQEAADAMLSRFARRLPGFSVSTPAYLRSNALSVTAAIEREPERIVVRLSRPPLYVLLAMTGLTRRRYDVPWLSEIPFDVFPEDPSS